VHEEQTPFVLDFEREQIKYVHGIVLLDMVHIFKPRFSTFQFQSFSQV